MDQKQEAQHRADRIRAFNAELQSLEEEGVLGLDEGQKSRVDQHHAQLLDAYARQFDIDISGSDKQLSWGMRIVSFLGALALSAAVFFFFYRFWGHLGTVTQVVILVAAPVLTTCAASIVSRYEKTLYFTSLLTLVALTCFVLNLVILGTLFNITPSQNAFLAWSALAFVFAYSYSLRLQLVAAMTCLMGYLAATVGTWSGCYWLSFGERPENFIVAGAVMTCAAIIPHQKQPAFTGLYRGYGLLAIFIAILIMANWGQFSYLNWSREKIEIAYQCAGFVLAAGVMALGIRARWPGTTNLGCTFFVLYLYTKLFDWWWDWLPKYLFFLLIGLIAVCLLFFLKRIRGLARRGFQ